MTKWDVFLRTQCILITLCCLLLDVAYLCFSLYYLYLCYILYGFILCGFVV